MDDNSRPMHFIIAKETLLTSFIIPDQKALSRHSVVLPLALVYSAAVPVVPPISVNLVPIEFSFVVATILKIQLTVSTFPTG